MNYEEQSLQQRHGLNAEDMFRKMLDYMENDDSPFLKQIAYLLEKDQCRLISTSSNVYCTEFCCDGGGQWSYDYETPIKKLPFQLIYSYALDESDYSDIEDVYVDYYNKEEEIKNDIEEAIKYLN